MGRKLQRIYTDLLRLERVLGVKGFFKNTEDSTKLRDLVEGICDAMMEYQVCIRNSTLSSTSDTVTRPRYSKTSTTRAVSSL